MFVSSEFPLPIPAVADSVAVPAVMFNVAALPSVIAPPSAVITTSRVPFAMAPRAMSPPAASSVISIVPVVVLVAISCVMFVRNATPLKVPASAELDPIPSAAVAWRMLLATDAVAASPVLVIDPRSPSAIPAPSLSATRMTVCDRAPSVVTTRPVLKTMSSPAVKVSVESAAAPLRVTNALLLMTRSSSTAAEFPAVKFELALTLTSALIVKGLLAVIVAPPVTVTAAPLPLRSVSVRAPVFVILNVPPITASRLETTVTSVCATFDWTPNRVAVRLMDPSVATILFP